MALAAWAFDRLAVARFGRGRPSRRDRLRRRHRRSGRDRPGALSARRDARARVAARGAQPALAARRRAGGRDLAGEPARRRASWRWPRSHGWWAAWPQRRFAAGAVAAAAAVPVLATRGCSFRASGRCPSRSSTSRHVRLGWSLIGVAVARRDRTLASGSRSTRWRSSAPSSVPSAIGNNVTRLGVSVRRRARRDTRLGPAPPPARCC